VDNIYINQSITYLDAPVDTPMDNMRGAYSGGVPVSNRDEAIRPKRNQLNLRIPDTYSAKEIERRCIEHLERAHDQMDVSQQLAHQELKELLDQHSDPDFRKWLSKSTLTSYMKLFARLFFCDDMILYSRLIVETPLLNVPCHLKPVGCTNWDPQKGPPCVVLAICKRQDLNGQADRVVRKAKILHTILHEMTHAVFRIYDLRGAISDEPVTIWGTVGLSGHGPCWIAVFRALMRKVGETPGLEFVDGPGATRSDLHLCIGCELDATEHKHFKPHPDLVKLIEEMGMADLLWRAQQASRVRRSRRR
jgi:hypothetical protein